MININLNGVKNTLSSFGVHFNFNFNKTDLVESNKGEKHIEEGSSNVVKKEELKDYKTTLSGYVIDSIKIDSKKITLHFFIDDHPITAWNLVTPIIELNDTSEYLLFGRSYFAFQGSGGGISNIRQLFWKMEKLMNQDVEVLFSAKVIDKDVMGEFYYHDSNLTLNDLKFKSTPLVNYQKEQFKYIYAKYSELKSQIN